MYYNFLHTDPYERVGKRKKERKTKLIYIAHTHTHTQLLTDNKKHPSTFCSIYMKKLLNEVSGERIVC